MTTSELSSYIRKQIDNNISKDVIISKLTEAGWLMEDINDGFSSIESELKSVASLPEAEIPDKKEQKPEFSTTDIIPEEIHATEIGASEITKVWIPMNVPIKENIQIENIGSDEKMTETKVVIQNQELKPEEKLERPKEIENLNRTPNPVKIKDINKKEELIPTLIPKIVVNSFGSISKDNKENLPPKKHVPITQNEKQKDSLIKNLPQTVMLSSYQDDLSTVNNKGEEVKRKDHKKMKWVIIVLIIIILALATLVFASGHINIPFIKKDPKILLLNNSKVLSSLKSYKTETKIEMLSPSFASIASGLINGEAIATLDKDSISINTLGIINQNENELLSDNFITIKSSLLQDYITTDIKNNGSDLFVSVPDLSQIIKENAPKSSIVRINKQKFDLIPSLFSPEIEATLKKINIYKLLSSGMSSYIDNDTLGVYDQFINSTEITEKGEENIKGIGTYHYMISTDRQLAKELLSKILDNFVLNLSVDDKSKLNQIIGSATVDSLDIWVGKGDNNIYQYNVILNVPLSKVIDFEDKSIGDNQVSINWKTTYYDFNVSNNITMPNISIPVDYFVKSIKETKIKNDTSSFKQLATNLFNIENTYGKKPNPGGSCIEPVSGSLFSPTGHAKNTAPAVSSISLLLNKILGITNNIGYCYSTTKAWSFTIPISDDYNPTSGSSPEYRSYFCVDSTGSTTSLTALPTGVVCLPTAIPKTD
jgi:hypothetical protein